MTQPAFQIQIKTSYLPDESSPYQNRFNFAYQITISNHGDQPAKLLSRRWLIIDGNENRKEVQGPGVVGQQPTIRPGTSFRYTSGVILDTPVGTMEGSYEMQAADSTLFDITIPCFRLAVPGSIN